MYQAPNPDRFQFILWTLLLVVTLVGFWVPSRVLPGVVLLVLVNVFARSLVRAARVLPERVATHFDFGLRPDGWMSRKWYLVLVAGMAVVVGGAAPQALFVPGFLAGNAHVQRMALWIACLSVSLLSGFTS